MKRFSITRRQLLGAVATTAVVSLARAGQSPGLGDGAANSGDRATPGGSRGTPAGASPANSDGKRLALVDSLLPAEELAHARATLGPLQPRTLAPDLVWQWRRGLAQELSNGVRAVAITRWDKAILLRGLAREVSLPVHQQRIAHSLFQTDIG
jgi:hypothetical protein